MKTPKINTTPHPKKNAGIFKEGKVKKTISGVSNKKSNPLTSVQKMGISLETVKGDGDIVNVKFNINKKNKLPPNEHSKKSDNTNQSPENKQKFDQNKKNQNVFSQKTPSPKHLKKNASKKLINEKEVAKKQKTTVLNKSFEQEHNSSPIKSGGNDSKKLVKLHFDINNKKGQKGNKNKSASPEVDLGMKLEGKLSPLSKNARKKLKKAALQKAGKLEVVKKDEDSTKNSANVQTEKKKKKRRKGLNKTEVSSIFQRVNTENAVKALISSADSKKSDKKELFDDTYVHLQFGLFKAASAAKGAYHVILPHSILPDPADICLITPDLKGKRNDPEEAIDYYTKLMKEKGIDFISEIIPIRKLKKEYSQFEERSKLANRFDAVLVDGCISKMARIGRKFARTKKNVCSVKLTLTELKEHFSKALRKVAIFNSGGGLSFSVQCGHIGMAPEKICDNIMSIGEFFKSNQQFIGPKNVSSAYIKTALSKAYPVYISLVNSNAVSQPKGKEQKLIPSVEDEVSTVLGGTVVVHPSGNVKVKKRKIASGDEVENKTKKLKTVNDTSSKSKEDVDDSGSSSSSDDESIKERNTIGELKFNDTLDGSDEELGSDFELESDDDDDDSDVEEEAEDEDTDIDDRDGDSDDEDTDSDDETDEAEIEAAENKYLKEVRELQDEISKRKAKHRVLKDKIQDLKSEQIKQDKTKVKQESKNKEVQQPKQKSGKLQGKPQEKQNKKNKNENQAGNTKKEKQNENVEDKKTGFSPKQNQNNARFQGKKNLLPKQNKKNPSPQAQQTNSDPQKQGKQNFNAQKANSPKQNNKQFGKNKKQGNVNTLNTSAGSEGTHFSKKGKFEKGKGKPSFSVPGKKFQPQKK